MDSAEVQTDEIICKCHNVAESTIRSCIQAGDLREVEQVTAACEAGGGCHTCHILLQLFIDQNNQSARPVKPPAGVKGTRVKKKGVIGKLLARF